MCCVDPEAKPRLGNFAAGVMLMIFRPLRVGDLVEAGGVHGIVEEVGVFATIINTLENKKAIIANSTITNENIINYSANGSLRVDMEFGIGYGDDIGKAKAILERLIAADERAHKDPAPVVVVSELGDSSVNILYRAFIKTSDYWDYFFETQEKGKLALEAAGCTIPFPQRDVHFYPQG